MILVDFNQIVIAAISVANKLEGELTESRVRHLVLNQILSLKMKHQKKYGDMVVCCDSGPSWRKGAFEFYKASGAKAKAESPIDWKFIYECLGNIQKEIDEFVPWKLVRVPMAEGDDIIATLAIWSQENDLQGEIFPEPQPVMIVSTDKDFLQLQTFKNVKQYNHITGLLNHDPDPLEGQFVKIIKGDAGDGVPNIFSDDDALVMKKRQKPMTVKRIEDIREQLSTGTMEPELHRNYLRNKMLIDLVNEVPQDLQESIIAAYTAAKSDRSKLFSYALKHKLKNLMDQLDNF